MKFDRLTFRFQVNLQKSYYLLSAGLAEQYVQLLKEDLTGVRLRCLGYKITFVPS